MTILVTGATGTVGRALTTQLLAAGHTVRALTRDPSRADLPDDVDVVRGDLTDVSTLVPALDGVTAAHLITFGGDDYAVLTNGAEIVAELERAGVRRVSILGGWDTSTLEPALERSTIAWTLMQPVEFMANTLDHAAAIRDAGEVRVYDAGRTSAAIHEADIAAVALLALTTDGHGGRSYLLTGGEAVTLEGKLRAVGDARGAKVVLTRLSEEQARAEMASQGADPECIDFAMALENDPPDVGSHPQDTVERLTGRRPRTFAEWAADHADAFVAR